MPLFTPASFQSGRATEGNAEAARREPASGSPICRRQARPRRQARIVRLARKPVRGFEYIAALFAGALGLAVLGLSVSCPTCGVESAERQLDANTISVP